MSPDTWETSTVTQIAWNKVIWAVNAAKMVSIQIPYPFIVTSSGQIWDFWPTYRYSRGLYLVSKCSQTPEEPLKELRLLKTRSYEQSMQPKWFPSKSHIPLVVPSSGQIWHFSKFVKWPSRVVQTSKSDFHKSPNISPYVWNQFQANRSKIVDFHTK